MKAPPISPDSPDSALPDQTPDTSTHSVAVPRTRLQRLLPFTGWQPVHPGQLKTEISAGVTVGLMVLPQGVAYAALAGMPLVTGIYAALLPALIAAMWGSSTRLSVGPTALTCLLIGSSLSSLATPGSAEWVQLAIWLAIFSGLVQLVLGLGRFGWLLNLVTSPVLAGFTQAAALLILASQLPKLLGWSGGLTANATLHGPTAVFGVLCLMVLLLARRWLPRFPAALAVIAASAVLGVWLQVAQKGVPIVGALPSGFPHLGLPDLPSLTALQALLLPTLIIAMVSFLETASSAKVEHQRAGTRWNENQDLVAQGLAKLVSALCGAFPTSTSFSRAAIFLQAGAKTPWATVVSTVVIGLALFILMPTLYHVPQAVLAAVVISAVVGLIKPASFRGIWRVSPIEAATAGTTFVLTLLTAPHLYWGVLAGVLMTLAHFLHHRLHPRIIEVGLHGDGSLRDRHLWKLPPLAPRLYALRMDAELDFASASSFLATIDQHLNLHPETQHVCLFAQPINRIDVSGVEAFVQLRQTLAARDITLHISGIKLPVEKILVRAHALPAHAKLRIYRADPEALLALAALR